MSKRQDMRRIYEEVLTLSQRFEYVDWDDEEGRWVLIHKLPLPPQYKKRFTALLIELPDNYPETPPMNTHVDPDLDIVNEHYLNGRLRDMGYKWLCAHPQTWEPAVPWLQGDNLFTIVASVRHELNLLKPARGQ
jgi:ubiquitin-protein ligase